MKSEVYKLGRLNVDHRIIPEAAEIIAETDGLGKKETLRLRLLAEEMICMLPQLLEYGEGEFWIETRDRDYYLHLAVKAEDAAEIDREKIIDVSTNKKNTIGIMGKIVNAASIFLSGMYSAAGEMPYDYFAMGTLDGTYGLSWSLMQYRETLENETAKTEKSEEWDELEKSVIANMADDVTVSVTGRKVDIIVKKGF